MSYGYYTIQKKRNRKRELKMRKRRRRRKSCRAGKGDGWILEKVNNCFLFLCPKKKKKINFMFGFDFIEF